MATKAFIAVDVETTGTSVVRGDRVIEIGAVRVQGRTVVSEFEELVFASRRINPAARRVHGITQAMLESCAHACDVLPRFRAFVGSLMLIAHNARFDQRFLQREF